MTDDQLLEVLDGAARAVGRRLAALEDWRPATDRPGQYRIDVVADLAALEVLLDAGLGVLSEESGLHHPRRDLVAVLDPVDGSTNASRGIPWFATSVCVLDDAGPRAALVLNQASGERFEAVRGGGARLDGEPVAPSGCADLADALVGLSGLPSHHWGWQQFRAMGSASLDLCSVACGRLDGYVDASPGAHGPWDYLGALLVCTEAGASVVEAAGQDLVTLDPRARRSPVAAATPALAERLARARGEQSSTP
ncbi:MAG: inositol monophosphatase family protein [Acidimicrobiales bacterium]